MGALDEKNFGNDPAMRIKLIGFLLAIFIILIIIILQINSFYPEKFKINNIEVEQFQMENSDYNGCIYITGVEKIDTTKDLLLVIKFDIEMIDTRFQYFWQKEKSMFGAYGHTDSICLLSLTLDSIDLNNKISPFANYNKIRVNKASWNGKLYSNDGCDLVNKYPNIPHIISTYNSSIDSIGYIYAIESPHLILLKKEDYKNLLNKECTITLKTNYLLKTYNFILGNGQSSKKR